MMWGNGWGWLWGGLMMVVVWIAIVWLVVSLVRGSGERPSHEPESGGRSGAEAILAERFARGEISEEEFEQRKRVLDRGRS
jgi:putative membrane protein